MPHWYKLHKLAKFYNSTPWELQEVSVKELQSYYSFMQRYEKNFN